jgi:hypothetical protein
VGQAEELRRVLLARFGDSGQDANPNQHNRPHRYPVWGYVQVVRPESKADNHDRVAGDVYSKRHSRRLRSTFPANAGRGSLYGMRLLSALFLCAVVVSAEKVEVFTVERSVVESRERAVPRKNAERAQLLRQYFEQDGCSGDNLTDQPVKHAKIPNLICTVPGETDRIIIVGAHMDFVDAGEGAIDNWTGASLLPTLYTSLKGKPRRHRFLFIGFTDEEKGLVGSDFYVHHLSAEERQKISGMVNMDSLGISTTEVELIHGDKTMLNALGSTAGSMKLPLTPMDFHNVGRSDSDSFQNAHIPAICFHSITTETLHLLHTPDDRLSRVNLANLYESYRMIAMYLAYLDQVLDQGKTTTG